MSYSRTNPSPRYRELLTQYRDMHQFGDRLNDLPADETFNGRTLLLHIRGIKMMIDRHRVASLLDYGCGKALGYDRVSMTDPGGRKLTGLKAIWGVQDIHLYDPGYEPYSRQPRGTFDAVVSTDVLEHCPEEDLEWIVSEIFGYSRKAVFCTVALYPASKKLPDGTNAHVTQKSSGWWLDLFERTKLAHNGRSYFLVIARTPQSSVFIEG